MKPAEDMEETAVPRRGVGHPRVAQSKGKDGTECRPKNQPGKDCATLLPQIVSMKIEPMATAPVPGGATKLFHGTTPMMERFMVK